MYRSIRLNSIYGVSEAVTLAHNLQKLRIFILTPLPPIAFFITFI